MFAIKNRTCLGILYASFLFTGCFQDGSNPTEPQGEKDLQVVASTTAAPKWRIFRSAWRGSLPTGSGDADNDWWYIDKLAPNGVDGPFFSVNRYGSRRVHTPFTNIQDMDATAGGQIVLISTDGAMAYSDRPNQLNSQWQTWSAYPEVPRRIAMSRNFHMYILTSNHGIGGYSIKGYNWATNTWFPVDGRLIELDIMDNGDLWGVNESNRLYLLPSGTSVWSELIPEDANGNEVRVRNVAVGGGKVFVMTDIPSPGGYTVMSYESGVWKTIPSGIVDMQVDARGVLWASNNEGVIFYYGP